MSDRPHGSAEFTMLAVVAEGGLAVLAVAIGWLIGFNPIEKLRLENQTWFFLFGVGVVATLPMFAGLWLIEILPWDGLKYLQKVATDVVRRMFSQATVAELAVVALCAGVGEEILFRGLIQSGISHLIDAPTGPWIALAIASLLFGFAHALTRTYVVLATLAGVYLGLLFIFTDNLWPSILAHFLYDFGALLFLLKWGGEKEDSPEDNRDYDLDQD